MKVLPTKKMGEETMNLKTALLIFATTFLMTAFGFPQLSYAQNPPGENVDRGEPTLARDDERGMDLTNLTGQALVPAIPCDSCYKDADPTKSPGAETLIVPSGDPAVTEPGTGTRVKK
jgi:hypothetical protein